jgi:hypothetical protein
LPASTSRAERERFRAEFEAAAALESEDPDSAEAAYRVLAERYPTFAETRYRLGRLLATRGEVDEAAGHFAAARDHDGLPMRALTSFQDACREVAGAWGAPLVDGQVVLATASPTGLLDDHMFHDGMHPSLRGHVTLARGVIDALAGTQGWPDRAAPRRLDPADVAREAGMVDRDWAFLCERGAMFANRTASLRFEPEVRWERGRRLTEAARRIAGGTAPDGLGLPGIGFREADRGPPE